MKWINVKDRLPEESDYYLVTNGVFVKRADYSRMYCKFYDVGAISGVTHWMPLPEPPKDSNNE